MITALQFGNGSFLRLTLEVKVRVSSHSAFSGIQSTTFFFFFLPTTGYPGIPALNFKGIYGTPLLPTSRVFVGHPFAHLKGIFGTPFRPLQSTSAFS